MTNERGPRQCGHCGATAARLEARFCEYCGTELPRLESVPAAAPSPFGDLEARFAALRASPRLAELLAHDPSDRARGIWAETGCLVAFGTLFVIVGLTIASAFAMAFPAMALIPIAIVALGIFAIGKQVFDGFQTVQAELERSPACVVDERTKLTGGGKSSTRTHYYVTLQFPGGKRRELEALEDVAGKVTRGDFGVAYFKRVLLLDFQRVS